MSTTYTIVNEKVLTISGITETKYVELCSIFKTRNILFSDNHYDTSGVARFLCDYLEDIDSGSEEFIAFWKRVTACINELEKKSIKLNELAETSTKSVTEIVLPETSLIEDIDQIVNVRSFIRDEIRQLLKDLANLANVDAEGEYRKELELRLPMIIEALEHNHDRHAFNIFTDIQSMHYAIHAKHRKNVMFLMKVANTSGIIACLRRLMARQANIKDVAMLSMTS